MKAAYLLIFVALFGCSDYRSRNNSDLIESFDISPDDKKVLLLSIRDNVTTVFEINADGQQSPKLILKPLNNEIFSNPRYSPNGKKIVFIKHFKKNFWESTVCISDRDGTHIEELTPGGELVTDAVFSAKGDDVLYCSSKQYNTSKKKGTTDARKFDIFTINLANRKATQLSKLNALGIDNLSEINEKYILFHLTGGKKAGIYSFEKDNPGRAMKMLPANGTQESNLLENPGYAPDKFLVYTVQSELYTMDLITRKADRIYNANGGHFIQMLRGFHTRSRVLFKKFDEQSLTSINTDGTEISLMEVEFPE